MLKFLEKINLLEQSLKLVEMKIVPAGLEKNTKNVVENKKIGVRLLFFLIIFGFSQFLHLNSIVFIALCQEFISIFILHSL